MPGVERDGTRLARLTRALHPSISMVMALGAGSSLVGKISQKAAAILISLLFIQNQQAFPQQSAAATKVPPIAQFEDVADRAGLTMTNVFGGRDTKKYII